MNIFRKKGDRYRPIVTIEKMKKERPSVVVISGTRYIMDDNSRTISKKGWNTSKKAEGWKSKEHYKKKRRKEKGK